MPDPLFADDDDANTPLTAEEREQLIPAYITLRHELNEAERSKSTLAKRCAGLPHVSGMCLTKISWVNYTSVCSGMCGVGQENIAPPLAILASMPTGLQWICVKLLTMHVTGSNIKLTPLMKLQCGLVTALLQSIRFPTETDASRVLIGDLLAQQLGQEPFTWGRANLVDAGETRARYIEALRAADNHDIKPLLLFARS